MRYRRAELAGGTYFSTANLYDRKQRLLVEHIDLLREAVRKVKAMHPFEIDAMVILPGHLPADERRSRSRLAKGERGIWQRRYWEHLIRDDRDYAHHVDYCHYNPVKHGYVQRAAIGHIQHFTARSNVAPTRSTGPARRTRLPTRQNLRGKRHETDHRPNQPR